MKIVVLGAAGNVGSRFARQAVAAGHEVVAYVRRPEAAPAGTEVVVGSAEDVETLASAAQGADVLVVSITGSIRDTSFMQRLQPGIIEAARRAQVKRVVLVSVFGAGETRAKASGFARLIYNTALRGFLADKAGAGALLMESGLNWTIVYPVNLKDAPALPSQTVKALDEVSRVPGMPTLPMDNAATGLLEVATDPATTGKRLLITTPTGWR